MPIRVTISPLTKPARAPTTRPTANPLTGGQCHQPTATPDQTPANARTEPIDRSNAPAIISSIMPVTRIPFCAAFKSTAAMFDEVGKLRG